MTGPCLHYLPVRGTHGPAGRAMPAGALPKATSSPLPTMIAARNRPGWRPVSKQSRRELDAATGRVIVPLPTCRPTDYERDAAGLAKAEFVTANCFCRRSVLAAIGGFDARFTAAWREDSDLQFTLLEHGSHIGRFPKRS